MEATQALESAEEEAGGEAAWYGSYVRDGERWRGGAGIDGVNGW
jgi:hypothetical protein